MELFLRYWVCAFAVASVLGDKEYPTRKERPEYDYVVVGAGSSGAVVANRLSEDTDKTVLLLEAGGRPTYESEIPLLLGAIQGSPMDWEYYTVPQENACLDYKEKRCYWPRGKSLGGTSAINAMIYVRGNPTDYDNWEQNGSTGWGWKGVYPYFLKSEDQKDPVLAKNGYHNVGGPLTVTTGQYATPLKDAFNEAAPSIGYKHIEDYNGPSQEGFATSQRTIRDGLRCSTEKAFLRPVAATRTNLDILTKAHVKKVLINDQKRAYAVSFDHDGTNKTVRASKEIILSAGALGSPQILMLSGIGPRKHLEEKGIKVIADLPVGDNLQDHIAGGGLMYVLNDTVSVVVPRDVKEKAYEDLKKGTGPLSLPGGIENAGFITSSYQTNHKNWSDLQLGTVAGMFIPAKGMKPEFQKILSDALNTKDFFHVVPILLHPKSRGTIRLNTSDPYDYPILDPRYFSVKEDLDILVEAALLTQKIVKAPSLQKYNPKLYLKPDDVELCKGMDADGKEFLECLTKALTITTHHQSGTCKMGNPEDSSTVVDPELRVKGIQGLRVADASIMPTVVSGNTNAPCIMIGEKASDIIRGRKENYVKPEPKE